MVCNFKLFPKDIKMRLGFGGGRISSVLHIAKNIRLARSKLDRNFIQDTRFSPSQTLKMNLTLLATLSSLAATTSAITIPRPEVERRTTTNVKLCNDFHYGNSCETLSVPISTLVCSKLTAPFLLVSCEDTQSSIAD